MSIHFIIIICISTYAHVHKADSFNNNNKYSLTHLKFIEVLVVDLEPVCYN